MTSLNDPLAATRGLFTRGRYFINVNELRQFIKHRFPKTRYFQLTTTTFQIKFILILTMAKNFEMDAAAVVTNGCFCDAFRCIKQFPGVRKIVRDNLSEN